MKSVKKKITYDTYKKNVINHIVENKVWEPGVFKYGGKFIPEAHILPLENNENTPENRAEAIMKYVKCDCKKCLGDGLTGLHQFAHHLTSSQQLCMKFFSELIDDDRCAKDEMVHFIKKAFGIDIHVGAKCAFEYKEKFAPYKFDANNDGDIIYGGYEGTSFDFHLKDESVEIYFEIKFTEKGFKKEEEDKRHLAKAKKYLEIAPQFLRDSIATPEDFLKQYQIYRNVIRAKDNNKYVVFISDENNPATNKDKEMMKGLDLPQNVIFTTWQKLIEPYPFELPFQLKAILNNK